MSSILDALGKLESSSTGGPGSPPPKRPRPWGPIAAAVVVAFIAGGIATWLLGDRDESTDPEVVARSEAPQERPPVTQPAPKPMGRLIEDTTTTSSPPPPTTTPPPPVPVTTHPTPSTTAPRRTTTTTTITTTPVAPTTTRPPTPPTTRPVPERARIRPKPAPRDAPDVRVSFLMYSRDPERRSVALGVAGAGITTVREGEYFQGVRVVEILPEAVDLEWGGVRYRVPARR
jgi:hypothetical protein